MNKLYVILLIAIVILNSAILVAVLYKPQSGNLVQLKTSPTPSPIQVSTPTSHEGAPTPTPTPTLTTTSETSQPTFAPTLAPTPTTDTSGFMANTDQARITNICFESNTKVTLTIQNTGSYTATIISATIDGNSVPMYVNGIDGAVFSVNVSGGTSASMSILSSTKFANSAMYSISLETAKGNILSTYAAYTGP